MKTVLHILVAIAGVTSGVLTILMWNTNRKLLGGAKALDK